MSQAANEPQSAPIQVGEDDLSAYAQGRLPLARRTAIEGFLAANPDLAARVMTQMHLAGGDRPGRRRRDGLIAAAFGMALVACAVSAAGGWTVAEHRELGGWREADGDDPPGF